LRRPGLPDKDELASLVKDTYRSIKREVTAPVVSELWSTEFEALVLNLRGLTHSEATRTVESAVLEGHLLCGNDLQRVIDACWKVPGHWNR
jgi:hypothetical protein